MPDPGDGGDGSQQLFGLATPAAPVKDLVARIAMQCPFTSRVAADSNWFWGVVGAAQADDESVEPKTPQQHHPGDQRAMVMAMMKLVIRVLTIGPDALRTVALDYTTSIWSGKFKEPRISSVRIGKKG
ncbi:MAG: hypothetical protein V3T53_03870 [Phycisphaerales bacterium]